MSGENSDMKNNANACLKEKTAVAGGLTVPLTLSPQSNMGSPNSANGLSPSDGCDHQSPHQNPCRSNRKHNDQRKSSANGTSALVQIIRQEAPTKVSPDDDTSKRSHRRVKDTNATTHLRARHNEALSISQSNASNPAFHPYVPAAGQDYKPYYYPSMPKGYDSPSTLPSLLPIRQLECPPPSRSLAEQKADVVGGAIEGKLCRGITLTRVEIRNSYLVNCTLINCISKGCYFTSTRLFASDIVNAPCVISCSLEDSFISLSILSNCKMLQGAVKESRIMDSDIEAAGVFYCRLTRSVFYQCEYKEIEQVDCDLRECDGNGDVDAFFPIVPPHKSSQGKEQKSANPKKQIYVGQKAPQRLTPNRDREKSPKTDSAPTTADESNKRDRTQEKIMTFKKTPSQQTRATGACPSGLATEINQCNEQQPLGTVSGVLVQQTHDSPTRNVANTSKAEQSTQTVHATQSLAHIGEKGETDQHRDSNEFNQYFRNQNENEVAAVPIHASGVPYPDSYETKVGTRGRRANMFCCQ